MTVLVEAALDHLGTGVLVATADGTVVTANRAALSLLDRPAGEDLAGGAVRDVLGDTFTATLDGPAAGRWSPRPGQVVEWQWSVLLPETTDEGRCLVLRDVSHRLADRARLRRQNRALAELVAMKAEFTAAVSHELRTPVTSIAAMSELLGEEVVEPDPLAGPVAAVARNAQRLLALIDNVTELARIENSAPAADRAAVDLAALAEEVVPAWAPAARAAAVHLEVVVPGPAPVDGERPLLRRLVDAMVGVGLAAADPGDLLALTIAAEGGGWRLSVPIGGRGGDRLFTSSPATADGVRHDSTALMLCRAIAGRHGGRLTTEPGPTGTVLAATLPHSTR
ncbi:hypothetical protein Drose_20670 [Dactylosporangium roseum]|uniref:histidine kinase n=1 Tax=Dactylosporangium roseum TaxID=47989 RepID=A0ABY5YYQ7_9ACTN|nr:histidine kinase dimerization/phospho-acceptor domain-containing protein [Dactylosporangium roseum]UWZ33708.1 hypothetical protein Drose_20670 [Dactylosporangium roseum]